MTYKCCKCGCAFDADNAYVEERFGEENAYCPNCMSADYEEARRCSVCGEFYAADEMYGDYCLDCLRGAMTVGIFPDFAIVDGYFDQFEYFILDYLLGAKVKVEKDSNALLDWLKCVYDMASKVSPDKLLDKILSFMDREMLWYEFSMYLEEKGV